jgi:putative FmdB family regulatory protein
MAFYDYRCNQCDIIHTVEHSVTETKEVNCGVCKVPMRKLFGSPVIEFKGKGWGHQ